MTLTAIILVALVALWILYSMVAVFICLELNSDHFHWWCPLCRLTRMIARRFE